MKEGVLRTIKINKIGRSTVNRIKRVCNFLKGESNRAHWSDVKKKSKDVKQAAMKSCGYTEEESSLPQEEDVQQFYHGSMPGKLRNIKEDKCDEGE